MPPVDVLAVDAADGSSPPPPPCTSTSRHELEHCFHEHEHWFIAALSTTALVLCCFIGLCVRRCCCKGGRAAPHGQTAESYLADIGRQSVVQQLMRQSQWGRASEHEPLLSPVSDEAISPSTKLLASSPLVRSQLREPVSSAGGGGSPFRSLLSTLSGTKRGALELINNDNYAEVRATHGQPARSSSPSGFVGERDRDRERDRGTDNSHQPSHHSPLPHSSSLTCHTLLSCCKSRPSLKKIRSLVAPRAMSSAARGVASRWRSRFCRCSEAACRSRRRTSSSNHLGGR
jgi:hypothetical protein